MANSVMFDCMIMGFIVFTILLCIYCPILIIFKIKNKKFLFLGRSIEYVWSTCLITCVGMMIVDLLC